MLPRRGRRLEVEMSRILMHRERTVFADLHAQLLGLREGGKPNPLFYNNRVLLVISLSKEGKGNAQADGPMPTEMGAICLQSPATPCYDSSNALCRTFDPSNGS